MLAPVATVLPMRQLLPTVTDVDPVRAYLAGRRPAPAGRPWVALGMIASLDGATAVGGRSGPLGGPADKAAFRAVRAMADVVLVAAGTVRTEGYGPIRISDDARAARLDAGRSPGPARLAIVTASVDLDVDGPLFAPDPDGDPGGDPGDREWPLVFTTTDADHDRVRVVGSRAEVRRLGTGQVAVGAALASLADDGVGLVVCEGGPSLNGALVAAGVVDEVCLSLSPALVGGDSKRLVAGIPELDDAPGFELVSLLVEGDMLLGRWVRADALG